MVPESRVNAVDQQTDEAAGQDDHGHPGRGEADVARWTRAAPETGARGVVDAASAGRGDTGAAEPWLIEPWVIEAGSAEPRGPTPLARNRRPRAPKLRGRTQTGGPGVAATAPGGARSHPEVTCGGVLVLEAERERHVMP